MTTKPILIPRHPGDLEVVFDTARDKLTRVKEGRESTTLLGLAIATKEALEMWIGTRPVAECEMEEEGTQQPYRAEDEDPAA